MIDRRVGAVAIGRNEGDRLRRCLASLSACAAVVYVDSGSADGSAGLARERGIEVVDLDMNVPFTAARARNAGFKRLTEIASRVAPDLAFVQFVDGDCELDLDWPQTAIGFLLSHPGIAAVAGRRRERHPERSVYNWLCDREWDCLTGDAYALGGDMMVRVHAFAAVGGFRDDLIAGEEPELCIRLRASGWRLWRLGDEMTLHDAAMTRLTQWWRRAQRGGYAFAQGAHLHGAGKDRHWVWETRRAWLWGLILPFACLACSLLLWPWGWTTWFVYPLQVLRQTLRGAGPLPERATLAWFQLLARFPEGLAQVQFLRNRLRGRRADLIEYK